MMTMTQHKDASCVASATMITAMQLQCGAVVTVHARLTLPRKGVSSAPMQALLCKCHMGVGGGGISTMGTMPHNCWQGGSIGNLVEVVFTFFCFAAE